MKRSAIPQPLTIESFMIWWMHRISEEFGPRALLKGGMELALMDSPRYTNDLDYLIMGYKSKNEIEPILKRIASEIPEGKVLISKHSKTLRLTVHRNEVALQIEVSVGDTCKSQVMTTLSLAQKTNILPKTISVMALDVAFSHKLAAWNERRLVRDLYDCYFFHHVQDTMPDVEILAQRLNKIESRIPKLKNLKAMNLAEFLIEFEKEIKRLSQDRLDQELSGLLPQLHLINLAERIKTSMHALMQKLRQADVPNKK